jgi:hypothetical protein
VLNHKFIKLDLIKMLDSSKLVKSYQATHYDKVDEESSDGDEAVAGGYASDTVTCPVAMGRSLKSLLTYLRHK